MKKDAQQREIDIKFGQMVHEHRNRRGYTQEFTAEIFDISAHTLRSIEQGKTECSWVLFVQLCVILNIDINKFAEEYFHEMVHTKLENLCLHPLRLAL